MNSEIAFAIDGLVAPYNLKPRNWGTGRLWCGFWGYSIRCRGVFEIKMNCWVRSLWIWTLCNSISASNSSVCICAGRWSAVRKN